MYSLEVTQDSILRVGEVIEVHGRKVVVEVDKLKNHPDLLYDGGVVRNISVGSYIEIRKGFLRLIGKVDGEEIREDPKAYSRASEDLSSKIQRRLAVSLVGYIDSDDRFESGTKELPLIGNEAFVVSVATAQVVHRLVDDRDLKIVVAKTDGGSAIAFPVDGLFNGHIAIFGNTGSGKSNTLAHLYQELFAVLKDRDSNTFKLNTRFLLFDFNGEYSPNADKCIITNDKSVYVPSSNTEKRVGFPLSKSELLDLEILSIVSAASRRTQRPFLRNAIKLYKGVATDAHARSTLCKLLKKVLAMSEKQRAYQLLSVLREVLGVDNLRERYEWIYNRVSPGFKVYLSNGGSFTVDGNEDHECIKMLLLYEYAEKYMLPQNAIDRFIAIARITLIEDVYASVFQYEHIAPVMGRLIGVASDLKCAFDIVDNNEQFWEENNLKVINLHLAALPVKKVVPLVISKVLYDRHKTFAGKKTMNIIIDEAHQILSEQSTREEDNWKDYRLETFEEIIKEGRKFGVFMTIASQRPYDVSPTITSQAHNFFIHRLVNRLDLESISKAVSYIDRVAEESIPTLPTGTCIFSGVASNMPIKLNILELENHRKPQSKTLEFKTVVEPPPRNRDHLGTEKG